MNDAVLNHFRNLASDLSKRPREEISIELKSGTVLSAKYDPVFGTITLGGTTFPAGEVNVWTKLGWGSEAKKIVKKLSPVSQQVEN
jgi:hypothetical protein